MTTLFAQARQLEAVDIPDVTWLGLVPLLIVAGGAVVLLTLVSVAGKWLPAWFATAWTVAIGVAGLLASFFVWNDVRDDGPYSTIANALGVDTFSVFLTGLLCATVVLAALLAHDFLEREEMSRVEYHVLLMLSAAGGIVMAGANDLIVMFLGLETLSIAVYVLAAMHLRRIQSQEAGLKYFVLGAFASAFFLYGIALVYGATGSTNLVSIDAFLAGGLEDDGLLFGGFAMLLVGLGFKVSAVPFHAWTPDVYEGAPSPAVSYMASGVKVAGFAAILRIFNLTFAGYADDWQPMIYALAVLTMFVGAVFAVVQTDVKRMLAYSSISHAGFILVGVQAATDDGVSSALYYLAAYSFVVLGSFAVVTICAGDGDKAHTLDDFKGLSERRPVLALAFTILLFAQAGVPFTTGFLAKFYVIGAAVDARSFWLAGLAMVAAVIAAFLYLRIVMAMYGHAADEAAPEIRVPFGAGVTLAIAVAFTLVFGLVPDPVIDLARDAQAVLVASP